jgi:heme/copper-type cytochrome/quinol oxidase subunit 2
MVDLQTSQTFMTLLILLPIVIVALIIIYTIYQARKTAQLRIQIESHRGDWPEEAIAVLLMNPRAWTLDKAAQVIATRGVWTDDQIVTILRRKLTIGMTAEMVIASWGKPNTIENKEVTAKGKKTRWIYGTPRKGAQYLWFTNNELTKIQS